MKKIVLIVSILFAYAAAFAQDKPVQISLRLAPNFSFTSLTPNNEWEGSEKGNTSFRIMFGPSVDFFFAENYAISTGLWYNVKAANIKTKYKEGNSDVAETDFKYNLQYLTIPATIKLYTNEVTDDVRIYFQVGGTIDIKLAEKNKGAKLEEARGFTANQNNYTKPINLGPYLGVGGELVLSSSNTVFAGLNYSRGVLPLFDNSVKFNNDLKAQTGQFAIEVGLKF